MSYIVLCIVSMSNFISPAIISTHNEIMKISHSVKTERCHEFRYIFNLHCPIYKEYGDELTKYEVVYVYVYTLILHTFVDVILSYEI